MIGSLVLKKNLSTIWEIEKWDDLYKLVQKILMGHWKRREINISTFYGKFGDGEISISNRQTWCGFWNFLLWNLCGLMSFCGTS